MCPFYTTTKEKGLRVLKILQLSPQEFENVKKFRLNQQNRLQRFAEQLNDIYADFIGMRLMTAKGKGRFFPISGQINGLLVNIVK